MYEGSGSLDGTARLPIDGLTHREYEVALALLQGGTNKEVAKRLGISFRTVEVHRAHIFAKLKVRGLQELRGVMQSGSFEIPTSGRDSTVGATPTLDPSVLRDRAPVTLEQILTGIEYHRIPDPASVTIFLAWDQFGQPSGYVLIPENIHAAMIELGLDEPDGPQPLPLAVSYGLSLSVRWGTPLGLSGDRALWLRAEQPAT